jgi:hypothetical protein
MRTNVWQPDPEASFARRLGIKPTDPGSGRGGGESASSGNTGCPEIWELDNGDVAVIGRDLTETYAGRLPAGTNIGSGERLVVIPRGMARAAKADIPDA